MPNYSIAYTLVASNRVDVRNEIINLFLNEIPGTGIKNLCSKYEYEVESFLNYKVTLKRPANLNRGFDFKVNVPYQGYLFKKSRRYHNPSHDDILNALEYNKLQYSQTYNQVKNILHDFFNCQNTILLANSMGSFVDYNGNLHPIEVILLAVKWLFIEQDVTYWNWSGRQMFWDKLVSNGLV